MLLTCLANGIYIWFRCRFIGNTFGLGAHLGVRYFFNNNVGAFIEAGNNGIGLSFNF
jgi:hypothetical protein